MLIEFEVSLSGNSLILFRGQFDTFLTVDDFHFVRFVCFQPFFIFCFWDYFELFGALSGYFRVRMRSDIFQGLPM